MDLIWAVAMCMAIPAAAMATKAVLWVIGRKGIARAIRW